MGVFCTKCHPEADRQEDKQLLRHQADSKTEKLKENLGLVNSTLDSTFSFKTPLGGGLLLRAGMVDSVLCV